MVKRKIVQIHEDKCNGCGACAQACHEGAIQMVDGKARLISDQYCDGLGDCLPACPTGAIEIIEREALPYDDEAVQELKRKKAAQQGQDEPLACGCPGAMARTLQREENPGAAERISQHHEAINYEAARPSELRQWPVQLHLVNPRADYFKKAHLLVAADCCAYAYGDFHRDFIKGRVTVIGCPKLDETEAYREKLVQILAANDIKSITVVRMEVPCCGGIVRIVKEAMLKTETIVPYKEIVIGLNGEIRG